MVLLTARMEEDGTDVVVYEDMQDPDKVRVRPISEWEEYVQYEDLEVPRFRLVHQEND
jgi:hypothetical protein